MEYPNELVEAVKAVADAINGEGGGGESVEFYNITFDLGGSTTIRQSFYYTYSIEDFMNETVDYEYRIDANINHLTLPIPKTDILCIACLDDSTEITGDYEEGQVEGDTYYIIKGDCTIKLTGEIPT